MSPFAGLCPLSKASYIHLQSDNAVSGVSIGQQWLVLGHFDAVVDNSEWHWVSTGLFLCCYIILQKSRDLIKILTSACMLQSYKFPEFQKFYGRRYRSLPVCFKVPSYQSSRSFLVADTDLCLSVAKLQVTRVPEVLWSQTLNSACPL